MIALVPDWSETPEPTELDRADEEERTGPTLPTTGDSLPIRLVDEDDEEPEPTEDSPGEEAPTREQLRSRRKREVRAKTIDVFRLTKHELEAGRLLYPPVRVRRPKTRAECVDGVRPCPFVSCAHHLYLDVTPKGSIKLNFPDLEPDEMQESCVLDVASRGGATLEETAVTMNITRERVRQLEARAIRVLDVRARRAGLDAYRGHAHDFDYAEPVAHQLPIVKRDLKPGNVVHLRHFAPPSEVTGAPVGPPEHSEASPDHDDEDDVDETDLDTEIERVSVEVEEEPMRICKRPGCNREFRGIRNMDSIAAGQEEWCRACRSGQEPSGEPTHANRGPEPKAKPAAKRPAKHAVSPKKKPSKAVRISRPSVELPAIDPTVSVADLIAAYRLVTSVGIELVAALVERTGG